jgi:hypothetical protein
LAPHRQSADSRNEKAGQRPTLIVITIITSLLLRLNYFALARRFKRFIYFALIGLQIV